MCQTLTKLILHGHDDLHLVQTVQTQIFHKVGGGLQLRGEKSDINSQSVELRPDCLI